MSLLPCASCGSPEPATAAACSFCHRNPEAETIPCVSCEGTGTLEADSGDYLCPETVSMTCEDCGGSGEFPAEFVEARRDAKREAA